jgi:hypothetical protein
MNKAKDEMLPEYDFSGKKGIRGKYAKSMKNGYAIRVVDGKRLVSESYYAAIDSDVREFFPDSRSINSALRKLIKLVPQKNP